MCKYFKTLHNVAKRMLYFWIEFFISNIEDGALFFLA